MTPRCMGFCILTDRLRVEQARRGLEVIVIVASGLHDPAALDLFFVFGVNREVGLAIYPECPAHPRRRTRWGRPPRLLCRGDLLSGFRLVGAAGNLQFMHFPPLPDRIGKVVEGEIGSWSNR